MCLYQLAQEPCISCEITSVSAKYVLAKLVSEPADSLQVGERNQCFFVIVKYISKT